MVKYKRSFSSGAKKTSVANEVIGFDLVKDGRTYLDSVDCLIFETFGSSCRFKINDEDTIHWVDANKQVVFTDIEIEKITILDNGVEYYYTAFSSN